MLWLLVTSAMCLAAARGQDTVGVLYKSLEKCSRGAELGHCLRVKAVTLLDRALSLQTPLRITEFVSLGRDPTDRETAPPPQSENQLEASLLPLDSEKKNDVLDDMIADRLTTFLKTRTLQFSLPADLIEGNIANGRKKKGKGGMLMMAAMAMGGMMLQMVMGKIAMVAGKALLVGKMALLLSAIIGLKKLLGSSSGGDSHQVVYATESHSGGGGWSRALEMAYRAHANDQANSTTPD
ncbi:hypothetical protein AAG570_009395 [Ranatra chinensis]|uniref:Protein osiris 12 n=1 Tax=Ranatra chinensis TaxID=642074 RepID=A0ABD0ZC85_9HEMI